MKKLELHQYHIADILTMCEVFCTCILGVLIYTGAAPEVALIVFGVGELCDAFDGICARKLKQYPNDGKYRWWRVYASAIDQITDVFHLSVMGIFFIFRICPNFTHLRPGIAIKIAAAVAIICIAIQIFLSKQERKDTTFILCVVLGRRLAYLACIATIVLAGIYAIDWPQTIKNIIISVLLIGAFGLLIAKWDRLPIGEIIKRLKKNKNSKK